MRGFARLTAAALALLLGAASAHAQTTTVVLRGSASIEDASPGVTLGQIAEITGPDATTLSAVVVASPRSIARGAAWTQVDLGTVRAALDGAGVNWGRVTLRGSNCTVRLPATPKKRPEQQDPEKRPAPESEYVSVDLSGPPTLRTLVAARLADLYGVAGCDLRLAFDPGDEETLGTLTSGRTVEVTPGASETSPKVPVALTVYSGESISLSRTVWVGALVARDLVTTAATVERNREIRPEQVTTSRQWVAPNQKRPATLEQVIGAVAQTRIAAGQSIGFEDVAPPVACKRGDTVYVHCLVGAVVVKAKSRALGAARDGEIVQLRVEGSEEPIAARMSGRGRAVMLVDAPAAGGGTETTR